ncbi:MAG: glycosyltransferase family 39 protein, partial [Candidatus Margulisbacteria bacterium]|nr:glycosyltransferase family 39 protein [Candidatus Margulisiibacteriota bacterium]
MNIFKQFERFLHSPQYWGIILLGGYIFRALAGLYYQHEQLADAIAQYMPISEALAFGEGYVDMRPPGFILFLAPIARIFGRGNYLYPAILIQSAVSLLLCYILYKITVSIFRSETAGRLAAGIAAFYPWLIYYSTQLSLEHWFVFWVALSVYCAVRFDQERSYPHAVLLGLVLSFTMYIRTVYTPYIILLGLFFLWRKIPWQKVAVVLLIVACFIAAWGAFNKVYKGLWTFTGGNEDHNLYISLNPSNKTGGMIRGRDSPDLDAIYKYLETLPPEEAQNWFKKQVWQFVRENPKEVLILAVKKMYIFWRPYPTAEGYTTPVTWLIVFCSFMPLL